MVKCPICGQEQSGEKTIKINVFGDLITRYICPNKHKWQKKDGET